MGAAQRSRRWLVPVTAVAVVAGVGAFGPMVADASPDLPDITAQELLTRVQTAKVDGLSGTVTSSTDLGLRRCPVWVPRAGSSSICSPVTTPPASRTPGRTRLASRCSTTWPSEC